MIPFYEEKNSDLQTFEAFGINFSHHLHTAVEMTLIESGTLLTVCDGRQYTLKKGDFLICFPNVIHSYFAPLNSVHYHMAICHPRLLGDYLNELMNFIPRSPVIRADSLHRDVPYALYGLFDENSANSPSVNVCRALTQLILARTIPHLELMEKTNSSSFDTTSRTIEYISKNFRDPMSLDMVAKEIGVSKCHLSHIFSSRLHTGFNDYVNSLRLSFAQNLLRNTDKDILSISLECGFESQRTFNRAFMKMFSTTPSKYRAECKK